MFGNRKRITIDGDTLRKMYAKTNDIEELTDLLNEHFDDRSAFERSRFNNAVDAVISRAIVICLLTVTATSVYLAFFK